MKNGHFQQLAVTCQRCLTEIMETDIQRFENVNNQSSGLSFFVFLGTLYCRPISR